MKTVKLEKINDAVSVLRFSRPEQRNALNWALMADIRQALEVIGKDNQCRVVILAGAGKSFCAGLDLHDQGNRDSIRRVVGDMPDGPRLGMRAQEFAAEIVLMLRRIPQPVIAAVHGHAYGGGLGIALACDLRIAARGTLFSTRFIRMGLSGCDFGVSYILPKLIGAARAHDMMLTAREVDAETALDWGMVTRLVDAKSLEQEAIALAGTICEFSPYGVISTKQSMWSNLDAPSLEAAQQLENRNQILNGMGGDVEAAAAAFFEQRKPDFKG